MANKLYTLNDLRNAAKKGRAVMSFQYIESRGEINECSASSTAILTYLAGIVAGVMSRSEIKSTPEKLAKDFADLSLSVYKARLKAS